MPISGFPLVAAALGRTQLLLRLYTHVAFFFSLRYTLSAWTLVFSSFAHAQGLLGFLSFVSRELAIRVMLNGVPKISGRISG